MKDKRISNRAKVILFRGRAAVGKTLLSNRVAQELGLAVIRKDDIYNALSIHIQDHSVRNDACELSIHSMVTSQLNNGVDIIVDTSWNHPEQVERFGTTIDSAGGVLLSFLCRCVDLAVWKERFSRRSADPQPNNIITDFGQLLDHYNGVPIEPLLNEIFLDTSPEIEVLVRTVLDKIRTRSTEP